MLPAMGFDAPFAFFFVFMFLLWIPAVVFWIVMLVSFTVGFIPRRNSTPHNAAARS